MHVAESKYSLFNDQTQTLKQQLETNISCNREMEQRSINASKVVLEHMDALHPKALKSRITIKESYSGCFSSLASRLQTILTQKVAAVSKSINAFCETVIEFWGSISKCEAVTKAQLERLAGGASDSQKQESWTPKQRKPVGPVRRIHRSSAYYGVYC